MNIESICRAIDQLAQMAQGWRSENSISSIERDIALDRIKPLYESLRFGQIEADDVVIVKESVEPLEIEDKSEERDDLSIDLDTLTFSALGGEIAQSSQDDPDVEVELIFEDSDNELVVESEGEDDDEESEIEVDILFEEEEESDEEEVAEEVESPEQSEEQTSEPELPTPMSRHDILLSLYKEESQPVVDLEIEEELDFDEEEEEEEEEETPEPVVAQTTIVEVLDFEDDDEQEQCIEIEDRDESTAPREQVFNIEDYTPEIEDVTIDTTSAVNMTSSDLLFDFDSPVEESSESVGDVMGRIVGGDIETVGERIASLNSNTAIFGEVASVLPLFDLEREVNINDRYLIAKDLFAGDMEECNRMLTNLNSQENFNDCMVYIIENHRDWDPEDDATKLVLSLLERKYPEE